MFNSLHGFGVKILLFKGLLPWPLSGSIDHNVIGGTQTIVNLFRINCFCVLTFTAVICLIYSTCETYHITHKNVADISFNTCIMYFDQCFSVDPFSKKDWYDVKAPSMFNIRQIGKTLVTRTQGTS